MALTIEQLNQQFNAGGAVRFEKGEGGLARAVLTHGGSEAQVYLHGAHVTHYRPAGQKEALYLSPRSQFAAGQPIRGGIPICFPWFSGAHEPAHGFARLREWSVESAAQLADGSVNLFLKLETSPTWSEHWSHHATLRYKVHLGDTLDLTLAVTNETDGPVVFEEALHTYLAVGDVQQVKLHGLGGSSYTDKVNQGRQAIQPQGPMAFTGETDRIYDDSREMCVVEDAAWQRRIELIKQHSSSTVVWNPWEKRAGELTDLGADQWQRMLCVETANVQKSAPQVLDGQTHQMSLTLRVVE